MTQKSHRAREALQRVAAEYPNAWKAADKFRADRAAGLLSWPDWCYLPLAAAYAVVSGGGNNRVSLSAASDIARVGAMQAWRMTQGIYRFDRALYEELLDTRDIGALPIEVLMQLPEWCVYIETPGLAVFGSALHGFWAHLEYDYESGRAELRLLLDTDSGGLKPWSACRCI